MVWKGKKSVVPNNPVTQTGSGNCLTDVCIQSLDPNTFENNRVESNYTKIEDQQLNFERKIVLPDELKVLVEDKITHHGWTFLYEEPIPINVSIVREFHANYWSAVSDQVFLRGKKVSISHRAIETLLHLLANPLKGKDDYQKALDKNKKSNLDMNELATKSEVTPRLGDEIFNVTRKQGIIPYGNWAKQAGGGPTKKRKASASAPPPRATQSPLPSKREIMDELRCINRRLKNLEELLSQAHPDLDYSRLEHTPEQQPTQDFEDEDEEGDTSSAAGSEQTSLT
ncbi:hypothetical protein PIB30_013018 [Stylosanthes scabra]|uniref:Putative plant transposon protein domain-containing protein n=1 Tax=Stylosanthes scabra TaxID=79078 RepID=A0ABU6R708_9FABA|nr:hypothetical protein [Stylosanthes scabra]